MVEICQNQMREAIQVIQEVAAWGRSRGFQVWREEWLTEEELVTKDAGPENFCIGKVEGKTACAFILQWSDSEYWPNAPEHEAAYLHKLCVRREFAHRGMTKEIVEAVREICREKEIHYIRLDTGWHNEVVRKIYQDAGFKMVDKLDCKNGNFMALYEFKV